MMTLMKRCQNGIRTAGNRTGFWDGGGNTHSAMSVHAKWLVYMFTFVLLVCTTLAGGNCPESCFCNTVSHIVYCSRKGLTAIPEGVDTNSIQLNFNGNLFVIPYLKRSNFSSFPLLEHLYLSECGIEHIEVETFIDLTRLEWLDLSNNRIRVIQDHTFRGLSLQHMFLNGNSNIQLRSRSFAEFKTNGLYLHDCSIRRLSLDVLMPLNNTVKYLWLQGNQIEHLHRRLHPFFNTLSHLRMGSNPLHCDCEMQWFYDFFVGHEVVFEGAPAPSCRTPSRLKGKYFVNLTDADFRCKPPSFHNIDAQFDGSHAQLRCSASGDPAPTLYWIQPTGESSRYNPHPDGESKNNEGVLRIYAPSGHERGLSGMYICVANNAAGNATMTLRVAWPTWYNGGGGGDGDNGAHPPGRPVGLPTLPREDGGDEGHIVDMYPPAVTSIVPGAPHHPPPPAGGPGGGAEDSVSGSKRAPERAAYNVTTLNMYNPRSNGERMFNLAELIGAVIGTLVCTLLLCFIILPIYLKRQWKKRHRPPEKPSSATLYLDGLAPVDPYMDTPAHQKRTLPRLPTRTPEPRYV